jgi:L,D-transpeptidase ErfK/SrfK
MNNDRQRWFRAAQKHRLSTIGGLPGLGAVLVPCLALAAAMPAVADAYRLASVSDSVIGTPFYVKTDAEHTLLDIGRHFGSGYDEMQQANPTVDMWVPGENKDVLVPDFHVLPSAPREGLVMNLAEKRIYFFRSATEVETFSVGVGREGWETPVGTYSIIEKIKDPTWTPPASIRKEHAEKGDILPAVVPAGPDNPLGAYAMRLSNPSYLIHGTNKPWGVGMPVSHGCTRMYPEDIERLFGNVETGTPVRIVDQPYKIGWLGDQIYLEVNAHSDKAKQVPIEQVIPSSIANAEGVTIDWDEVRKAVGENAGLPRLVGGRQGSKSWHHLDMIF